jgi:hypothetical protein
VGRLAGAGTEGNAVPGRTFVAYFDSGSGISVSSLRNPDQSAPVVSSGRSVPVRLDADGNRLAWGTDTVDAAGNVHTMLFVGTVTPD